MSDNQTARQDDIDVETAASEDELDESVVADRQPRAPSITRLGRYRLVREIASGGMATVNLAVAEGLDKLVALKIIHPHLAQEDNFVRMFLDEARLASAISHRNVCNVFDFGETDGRFYIAMDFLAGQSLRDVLRRLRKAELQVEPRKLAVFVAYMLAEACEGLHAAHELHGAEGQPLNVVHRDVSPHNLFVTYDGNVSVVDFGIARASDRIQSTATGVLKGKFSYMAPEQMRQLDIDRRADIWALGVVLWESLLLRRLFVRSSQADTVMSVMMDRVRPPSELNPDIPKELDAIVLKAIQRNPAHRYSTAREMGRELMKFCRESAVMVSPIEIEQLMHKLFEREIAESKALMRRAKQNTGESGVWMEVTPSGFSRVPLRSGAVERTNTGSNRVSVVGESSTGSIRNVRPAELARTADPLQAVPRRTNRSLLVVLALGAGAAAGVAAMLTRSGPTAEPLAAAPQDAMREESKVQTSTTGSQPTEPIVTPLPGSAAPTPPAEMAEHETTPAPRATPTPAAKRVETRVAQRPVPQKANAPSNGQREAPAQEASSRNVPADELAVRGAEPAPSAPLNVAEPREELPAPAPVTPTPTPVAIMPAPQPVAVAAAQPARPSAPQKLEANATIADLDAEGSLGSSIVLRMLSRSTSGLKSCYAEAAKKVNRNDFSPVPISLIIDEGGAVRELNVARHPLPDLSGCITNTLKRLRSERVPDVGTVQVKFRVNYTP
jgi:eukaryotic-like serine/threonine-protein kinase